MSTQPLFAETVRQFRELHPKQYISFDNRNWEYVESGAGSITIVLVGGGGSTAESMLGVNIALSSRFRVISIGLPAHAMSLANVIGGIESVMDLLDVKRAALLGHSLGGTIVQYFALRRPHRVACLVLSGTAFYLGIRSYIIPLVSNGMALAPTAMFISMVRSQVFRLLAHAPERQFWISFYGDELNLPDAGARLKHQFRLLAELAIFFRRNPQAAATPELTSIPALILCAEDDRGFTRREFAFLGNQYNNSRTVILPPGTGHLSFLTRPDEYIETVRQFIQNTAGSLIS